MVLHMPYLMLATMVLPLLLLVVLLGQTLPVSSFHHVSGAVVRRRQQPISFHNRRRSIDSILSNAISRTTNAGAVTSTSTSLLEGKSWYSDPDLSRSSSPVSIDRSNTKILISQRKRGMVYIDEGLSDDGGEDNGGSSSSSSSVRSLFLSYDQVADVVGVELLEKLSNEGGEIVTMGHENNVNSNMMLVWIGEHDGVQYWVLNLPNNFVPPTTSIDRDPSADHDSVDPILKSITEAITPYDPDATIRPPPPLNILPLREFGDRIPSPHEAAIHGTANGLLEFHDAHPFCPLCGARTRPQRSGASRICSDHPSVRRAGADGGGCRSRSVYPRIDVASIMLVTSPCGRYALLGRKVRWPAGRYSTLAGFLEVGETFEECCARETLEESGVVVDMDSVEFVQSQPWPFPRSIMVGFRARAMAVGEGESSVEGTGAADANADTDAERDEPLQLPKIKIDEFEMEDIRWFHRDYVADRIAGGGSTALSYKPTDDEKEFHIPGKASLARSLIVQWATEVTS